MTIRDYTEEAVRKYLRTVLLVDDRLFSSKSKNAAGQEDGGALDLFGIPNTLESGISSSDDERARCEQFEKASQNLLDEYPSHNLLDEELSPKPLDKTPSPSAEPFSPQKVVEGFYRQGIVCGLYEPKTSEFSDGAIPQSLVDLCDHSDVFILDWKLKDNQADSPVPALVWQLLSRDESCGEPRAVRFCAIYTDELLGTVFSKLHSEIKTRFPQKNAAEDFSIYRIHLEGLTIRLYRKTDATEAAGNPKRFVPSADLAETIVQDFVTEYEGIMSATALRGIAEVRDNAKRILDKFPPALDYALMVHGGLTVKAPTVPEDMQELLSDEIRSILSESPLTDEDVYGMMSEKADKIPAEKFRGVFPPKILKNEETTQEEIKAFFCDVLKRNDGSAPNPFIACNPSTVESEVIPSFGFLNRLLKLVKKVSASPTYSEGGLSQLFCYRTVYGNTRVLKFGTIVREMGSERRYVCMMPTCDCVRLDDDVIEFPFWELTPVDANHRGHAHGALVTDDRGKSKTLCVKGKIRKKMRFWKFHANRVVKFEKHGEKFILSAEMEAKPATRFEWVAALKPLHAQRMAEYVSRQFSRVGLAESEWLRLQVDR